MRIFYYPECNFNINKARVYDVKDLAGWFDSLHVNPDDYEIVGRDGKTHDSSYEAEVVAVYPKIMGGGKKKGKNILTAVVGLALTLATGGALGALTGVFGSATAVHTLGVGLLLSGGGALMMGQMKMPSMDMSTESSTKQSYQWNVGNLSTSRGVKGVTFGSDVVPEGELLAYRTYGTSDLETVTRSETYYVNETYKSGTVWDRKQRKYVAQFNTRRVAKTRTINDSLKITDGTSFLELLIGCGEGVLDEITDIKVNDTPIEDLGLELNTDYAIRLGTNTQTSLNMTDLDSQAGYSSIGQTVPQKLNGSVTPLVITTPVACDSCIISFQANNWYMYDTSSGAKNKAYIKPKIGYRASGSSGSYTYLTKLGVKEVDSGLPIKAESAFYFQVKINFPSNGTYEITLENDSAELNNTKGLLSNAEYTNLPDRAVIAMSCDNIACYNKSAQTYPNTALIYLKLPASQLLNGSMPKVTWKQSRSKIYAYNGSAYVGKDADNLAWAIYDILAQVKKDGNTYHNEGESVNNIDYARFEAFATFCESIDAKGNWFLNKLDTSWATAMSVATSCRAFIGLRNGKACPYWDAPAEMTQIFTVGNYENMSGTVTAKKDRAKAIEATFNNEEENFKSRTVRVEIDNDHSAEAVSTTFVGLSTPASVSKAAHYLLRRNKYLVQTVKFTADIDSLVCELNDVIGIQCDITEYGVGGRVFKVEGNKISLDAPVTLSSGHTYALLVRHSDGSLERNTPTETNGTYTQLTFSNAWSKAVEKGDIYSFGVTGNEVRKYRVTGIARTSDLKATIEAIEYNPNVYNELTVEPYTYTNPNAGINSITTTYNPESVDLAWDANNNTAYVDAYLDGVYIGRYERGVSITNVNSTQQLELVPVNEYGESSASIVRTISNSLPTPSTPPVPIVHSTTTGCVAEFDGIPKNENIVWLVIKEGETELGRTPIMGEYITVSIQLTSGSHTLTAYFLNQYNKTSQGRTFTGVPLGDIQANDISATALKLPTGSILRLSAKNCTTASIAEDKGVKDCSGWGNHGKAYGGVTVLGGGDGFGFGAQTGTKIISTINNVYNLTAISFCCRMKYTGNDASTAYEYLFFPVTSFTNQILINLNSGNINASTIGTSGGTRVDVHFNNFEANKEYFLVFVIDYLNKKLSVYVDAVEEDSTDLPSGGSISVLSSVYLGNTSNNNRAFHGIMRDVRIYPRALSATEIKSIFMIPDETVFAQLTTDMFGANIIRANYILNDGDFQTLAVNAVNANINNLNVAGNATFTGLSNKVTAKYGTCSTGASTAAKVVTLSNFSLFTGAQISVKFTYTNSVANPTLNVNSTGAKTIRAKGANLTASSLYNWVAGDVVDFVYDGTYWVISDISAKDYSNTELAKKMSIASYCASSDTTKIDGGNIYAGSITALQMAANSIDATKLSVVGRPSHCCLWLTPQGQNDSGNGAAVPDISGSGYDFSMYGAVSISHVVDAGQIPWSFVIGSTNGQGLFRSGNTTIPAKFTLWLRIYLRDLSNDPIIFDMGTSTSAANRLILLAYSDKSLRIVSRSSSNVSVEYTVPNVVLSVNNWYDIIIRQTSATNINVRISSHNNFSSFAGGDITVNARSNFTATLMSVGCNIAKTANRSTNCNIATVQFYGRDLSDNEIMWLRKNGIDADAGQITADRIAAGSVETKHLTADAIVGKTFQTASNTGTSNAAGVRFNSSGIQGFNGSAKTFDLNTNGKLACSDVDLTGKITASSGKIGDFTISDGTLTYSGSKYSQTSGIVSVTSTYGTITDVATLSGSMIKFTSTSVKQDGALSAGHMGVGYNNDARYASFTASGGGSSGDYGGAIGVIQAANSNCFGLYVIGKIRANSTDYGSDEKTKKDFKTINVLDKLKGLNVCAWRFDEEKLIEKQNKDIDKRNIEIEAENKAIDAENAQIEKENELRKNRKDGEPVELIPLKEHKKLREHRIADKNANHPLNIGCMAGEFNKAFGTNDGSEDCLSVTDVVGVCMRAIQELAGQVDNLALQIASLKDNNSKDDTKNDAVVEPTFEELVENPENSKDGESEEKK